VVARLNLCQRAYSDWINPCTAMPRLAANARPISLYGIMIRDVRMDNPIWLTSKRFCVGVAVTAHQHEAVEPLVGYPIDASTSVHGTKRTIEDIDYWSASRVRADVDPALE
jgi:hypothetical protein